MKAREVVDLIKRNSGFSWNERSTRDTFKSGDPEAEVKGIATTMIVTFDMLKRANQAGLNMVITHEDTWWNDPDNTKDLTSNPLYLKKKEFIDKNGIIIWRNHDGMHAMKPDFTVSATLRAIGVKGGEETGMRAPVLPVPEMTLGEFASQVKRLTGFRAIRCVGDPKAKISKILDGPGYGTPRMTLETDVVVGGESQEADGAFDNVEYVADAASLGINKGLVMLGHVVSEQPGMEDLAKWLQTFIKGIPIQFVPAEEPFWT
jgi:putative NIF3 family GTP cyclohydrolase 1 type 2